MPQPMSTPTAAGMIAPLVAITEPTVAPRPKCTSGMAATWLKMKGMRATFSSWRLASSSMGTPRVHIFTWRPLGTFKTSTLRMRRPQSPGGWGAPLPPGEPSVRNLNTHDILQHAIQTTEHRQLVDLLGHLLERLQLLQAQQSRVLVHESCGVEQRTGRCRFLT